MKNEDVKLINRILSGDETAFVSLVNKYKKQVHALAWRKIGDFHIAEEITQDTFLKVYQKLSTLKKPSQFSGWLYVIATNQCRAWLRRKRIETESLDDTETEWVETTAYSRYVAEEQAKVNVEAQREVVKKLLAKLKESERTVITLHYFGEMTIEEISRFLGVSASAIKLRLHRARQRLQKEEPMIREALSNFQLSPYITDNIMQTVEHLKPAAPSSGSKPFIPWVIGASSIALIALMLGLGSQYLAHFQQPYSLDSQSELAVELIDAPILLNLEAKPDIRNQFGGSSNGRGKGDSAEQESNQVSSDKGDYTKWALPKGAKARLGKGSVREVAYSPDGNRLAAASGTGVWIYDVHTGKELSLLTGHVGYVLTVAFSPDGNTIASGSGDDTVILWDTDTGQLKHTLIGHKSAVTGVVFSSDGKILASSSMDSTLRVWDAGTGKLRTASDGMPSSITGIAISPDGKTIVGWGGMKKYYLLDVATGNFTVVETEHFVSTTVFSPDGDKIAIGGGPRIQLLDLATGRIKGSLNGHRSNVTHLTFNPDGNTLASASLDKTLQLWNFDEDYYWNSERFHSQTTLRNGKTKWFHVVFSPDGNTIAGVGGDGTVLCFDVITGEPKTALSGHTGVVESMAFSPYGNIIASGNGNQVLFWDINTQQQKVAFNSDGQYVKSIVFSPDGNTLVTGNENNTGLVWDMLTGQQKHKIKIPRLDSSLTDISAVTYSPDGNLIATSGGFDDDSVYLWDAENGKLKATLEGHKQEEGYASVESIAFSPDGKTLASGHSKRNGIIQLWDVSKRQLKATLKGHPSNVFCVVFSPDGNTLASSGGPNSMGWYNVENVRLWNPSSAKQKAMLKGHEGSVVTIAFSHDGKTIATGSIDKTVRIWDSATKQQIALFEGHKSSVNCVAYSTDGKTLASGSTDGTILLWDLTSLTNSQHSQ